MTATESEASTFDRRLDRRQWEIPAWHTGGLSAVETLPRRCVHEMTIPSGLRDQFGAVAAGALGILCDSALGYAVMTTVPLPGGMATSHLHLELVRSLAADTNTLRCAGEQRSIDDRFGLGEGDVSTDDGTVVAKATIGAVLLTPRSGPPSPSPAANDVAESGPGPGPRHRLIASSPVLDLLGTNIVSVRQDGIRMLVTAKPQFANSTGGIHGGFGVLMGERALDVALRAAITDERSMRPVELRAAFLRPIPATGAPIECRATVMHLGRRLAAARGEVCDQQGRSAVLVDATYIAN